MKDQPNLSEMEGNDRGECGEVTGGETRGAESHGMSRGKRRWGRLRWDVGCRGELCPILSMGHFSIHSTQALQWASERASFAKPPPGPCPSLNASVVTFYFYGNRASHSEDISPFLLRF